MKTVETYNKNLPSGMAASGDTWSSDEMRKLLKVLEVLGRVPPKSGWQPVAAAVGSRNAGQCWAHYKYLKKLKRLEPISETTPLRPLIWSKFYNKAFDRCVAEHLGDKKITTVGQLAALDLDVSKPENKIYLMKLTEQTQLRNAVRMATPWKEKATEAIAFWR